MRNLSWPGELLSIQRPNTFAQTCLLDQTFPCSRAADHTFVTVSFAAARHMRSDMNEGGETFTAHATKAKSVRSTANKFSLAKTAIVVYGEGAGSMQKNKAQRLTPRLVLFEWLDLRDTEPLAQPWNFAQSCFFSAGAFSGVVRGLVMSSR